MTNTNFEIITASNGEEAYQRYVEFSSDINLILMDIHMPILNGYQSATKIRDYEANNYLEPTYIVALSGDSSEEHDRKCRQA